MADEGFWIGGFEGADHVNMHGTVLDMVASTGHLELMQEDYDRVWRMGFRSVRESVGWRVCSASAPRGQPYNFSRLRLAAIAAQRSGLNVLWTLMHYGIPEHVLMTGDRFPEQFSEFAGMAAREIRQIRGIPSTYTPINEMGFLAWAYTQAHLIGGRRNGDAELLCGYETKCQLVKASLAGVEAIRREDPGARFLHIEPLIHVAAGETHPEMEEAAATFSGYQWQAWDMLLGRLQPDLGGNPAAVDLIGTNHYYDSQWELPSGQALPWNPPHPSRRDFSGLLEEAWRRYSLPVLVAETSHFGDNRVSWLEMIVAQTDQAMKRGIPVEGICLYPVVDRPDWNDGSHWHRSGLWDSGEGSDARLGRSLACEYASALIEQQRVIGRQRFGRSARWNSKARSSSTPGRAQLPIRRHQVSPDGSTLPQQYCSAPSASGSSTPATRLVRRRDRSG